MSICSKCRFWSVCVQIGCGPMEALCLKDGGPKEGKMTTKCDSCQAWASNHYGAMDDPSGKWSMYETENNKKENQ